MESFFLRHCISFCLLLCFIFVDADPEFCSRGFKMASRFYKCWEQATFENKYPPLHEPHQYLDSKFVDAYASHMCSVVKPEALGCLKDSIKECTNSDKLMDMADQSGGACLGNRLNPYFKAQIIDRLVPIEGDSPCFELADNTYECYKAAGQQVMQMGGSSDDIVTFHRVADKFFNAYWECMVEIYKSNVKICPHWQIPMLLTLQKTAMPSLFGLQLRPEQVQLLELGGDETETGGGDGGDLNPGPSKLFLLLQLHDSWPEVGDNEDSIVVELSDLNHDPHLELENGMGKPQEQTIDPRSFTLKELKKLLRDQRRRNTELKEFIKQAKDGLEKQAEEDKKKPATKGQEQHKLMLDRMIN